MPPDTPPSGPLIFGIMFALVLLFIGALFVISRCRAWLRGESFLPQRPALVSHDGGVVKPSQIVMSLTPRPDQADQADRPADRPSVSADTLTVKRLQLDRTKQTIIEVLVYNGWTTGEIRAVLKGDNGVIGTEVEAARKRLGMTDPERTMRVRDASGERVISVASPDPRYRELDDLGRPIPR